MKEGERNDIQWTTEPPTQEGWYWIYVHHDKFPSGPNVDYVQRDRSGYLGISNGDYLETFEEYAAGLKAYWLGPLPIPEPPKGE